MKSNNVILYIYETLMSKPRILPVILNDIPFEKDMRVGQGPKKSSWHDQGDRHIKRLSKTFLFWKIKTQRRYKRNQTMRKGFSLHLVNLVAKICAVKLQREFQGKQKFLSCPLGRNRRNFHPKFICPWIVF